MEKLVSILIPNYKTPDLTKLCLRLLRKHTDPKRVRVIVIDNNSQDESLAYLKTLSWIELIEREVVPGESGPQSHARALELGFERVDTPYVLSIHTDTLVKNSAWLNFLLDEIEKSPLIAGVGSWKLEFKSWPQRMTKKLEENIQASYYRLIGKTNHKLQGHGDNFYYIRSHCALYRTALLHKHDIHFSSEQTVGKQIHKTFIDLGYQMVLIPGERLVQYMEHLNHATMVLNPELGSRKSTITKGIKRIKKGLERFNADMVLQDSSLDS